MATNKHETYVRFEEKDHRKLAYLASKEHRSTNSLIVHFALDKL
jgi:predicted HicB family RNase H-like nuclease